MQVYTISFFQNVLACNKPRLYLIAWSDEKWKQAVELFKKKKLTSIICDYILKQKKLSLVMSF